VRDFPPGVVENSEISPPGGNKTQVIPVVRYVTDSMPMKALEIYFELTWR
jgi:hypothetical protein